MPMNASPGLTSVHIALPKTEYVPVVHAIGDVDVPLQANPAGQGLQEAAPARAYAPELQATGEVVVSPQLDPGGQGVQIVEPSEAAYVPGLQTVQFDAIAPDMVPLGQARHDDPPAGE